MWQGNTTALQHGQPHKDAPRFEAIQMLELPQTIHDQKQLQLTHEIKVLSAQTTKRQEASVRRIILNQKISQSWS